MIQGSLTCKVGEARELDTVAHIPVEDRVAGCSLVNGYLHRIDYSWNGSKDNEALDSPHDSQM